MASSLDFLEIHILRPIESELSYLWVPQVIYMHIKDCEALSFFGIFSITMYPSSTPSPHHHHSVVHVHESFFLFARSVHPLTSHPKLLACSISMSVSLFCLLVQSVH